MRSAWSEFVCVGVVMMMILKLALQVCIDQKSEIRDLHRW